MTRPILPGELDEISQRVRQSENWATPSDGLNLHWAVQDRALLYSAIERVLRLVQQVEQHPRHFYESFGGHAFSATVTTEQVRDALYHLNREDVA